ncbi:MAG: hypothetical protein ACOCUL_00705 [Bacteroidota bacterium]
MKKEVRILGLLVSNRNKEVAHVQEVLTNYGCFIKTRLGLHNVSEDECSPTGLIILELMGDQDGMDKLENKLKSIEGVNVQKMIF